MKENYYNYKFIRWIQKEGPVLIVSSDRIKIKREHIWTAFMKGEPPFATVFRP